MSFSRQHFYGSTFGWYMVDATESLAMFSSGYGPIPRSIFENEDNYLLVQAFFERLPVIGNSYYSPRSGEITIDATNIYYPDIEGVSKGLYVYDNKEYTDDYELIAIPKAAVKLSDLDVSIQKLLKPYTFENIIFAETSAITITSLFSCD